MVQKPPGFPVYQESILLQNPSGVFGVKPRSRKGKKVFIYFTTSFYLPIPGVVFAPVQMRKTIVRMMMTAHGLFSSSISRQKLIFFVGLPVSIDPCDFHLLRFKSMPDAGFIQLHSEQRN